jgi:molybdate transport system substrate-binding protein
VRRPTLLAALAAVLTLAACTTPQPSTAPAEAPDGTVTGQVRIAAASDLKFALDEVVDLATTAHPELTVTVTYGSSGMFLQQIQDGAPFDLYLSADLAYPRALVAEGLAEEADLFPYAVGRLALWVPEGSALDPDQGLAVLTDDTVRRVAVANPEHAPYGRAALAALRTAGLEEQVAPKLVLGENVAQAAEFVLSGNADAGIVALSLVLSDPLRDEGRWAEVPLDAFPTLEQGGVVLARATHPEAARTVRDTLLGPDGREVLERYGFVLPEEP